MRLEKAGEVARVEHGERIPIGLPGAREGRGVGEEFPGLPGDRRGQLVLVADHGYGSIQVERQGVIKGVHDVERNVRFHIAPDFLVDMIRGKSRGPRRRDGSRSAGRAREISAGCRSPAWSPTRKRTPRRPRTTEGGNAAAGNGFPEPASMRARGRGRGARSREGPRRAGSARNTTRADSVRAPGWRSARGARG